MTTFIITFACVSAVALLLPPIIMRFTQMSKTLVALMCLPILIGVAALSLTILVSFGHELPFASETEEGAFLFNTVKLAGFGAFTLAWRVAQLKGRPA